MSHKNKQTQTSSKKTGAPTSKTSSDTKSGTPGTTSRNSDSYTD